MSVNYVKKHMSKEWLYYLEYYKPYYRKIISIVFITVAASILILPIAFIVRTIFDQHIPTGNYHSLILSALIILLLQLFSSSLLFLINYLTLKLTKHNITLLRKTIIKKLYDLSFAYYSKSDIGQLQTVVVQDTERIDIMSNALISSILPSVLVLCFLIPVLIYLNIYLFIVLLFLFPLFYLIIRKLGGKVRSRIASYQGAFAKYNKGILFLIESIDLTRSQTAEKFDINQQHKKIDELKLKSFGMAWLSTAYRLLQEGLLSFVSILILIICGVAVLNNVMSIGDMISFYIALAILRTFLIPAISNLPRIIEGNESLKSVYNILHLKETCPYMGKQKIAFQGNIEFNDVTFGYDKNQLILDGINLNIPKNSYISITGINGSGKTTILNLILGYYTPLKGDILADGISYENIDIKLLRQSLGVVRQNSPLFSGTIKENLIYGNPKIDDKTIINALESSLSLEFIEQLPNKIDTEVGVNGMILSGGERQRIAIARAIIRKPKLLIFDELATHLDKDTIKIIMENINALNFPTSVIIISHNENVVDKANVHYQIKNGLLKQLSLS